MKRTSRLAAVAAATALVAGAGVMGATTASATSLSNHCGSSYSYLGSWALHSGTAGSGNPTVGWIDIYWSNYYGNNCAIARPMNGIVAPNHIQVKIALSSQSGWAQTDGTTENYTQYAGPVYVHAPSACIDFIGSFDFTDQGYSSTAGASYYNEYC